jgi:hypothetical protein
MKPQQRNMKKIVLMEREGKDTQKIQFVNKIALKTGDTSSDQGFENSTPTYFKRINGIKGCFTDGEIYFAGNIFKEHLCEHKEIRVFCNTNKEYGEGVNNTPAIVKFLDANFIKVYEE